ncbi:hypothetical protein D0T53_04235 [Dysgonomonas sp. 216]|uniref:hypothetical protein n=1 Tax=Dysgonomonas sp. 216 TaxID=2302934 RepID=UPI0013D74071|nr:hypothetical protein [Dysgonomonas sp. 216]NDW18125.1 hypothetical protein [Dysgonomonas sp. 216]
MERRLLFVLVLLCSLYAYSQNKVSFEYDQTGNRTKKTLVVTTKSLLANEQPEQIIKEEISKREVKIYSAIKGQITVEYSTLEGMKNGTMAVYSFTKGTPVLTRKIKHLREDLDISRHPSGIYILLVDIDGEKTSYKLIK